MERYPGIVSMVASYRGSGIRNTLVIQIQSIEYDVFEGNEHETTLPEGPAFMSSRR